MAKLKKYVRDFPFYIARDYGPNEIYDLGAIEATFDKYKFPEKGKHYAYAMFSDDEGFEKLFGSYSEIKSRQHYRQKIADKYFNGNHQFTFHDLILKTRFLANISIYENLDGGLSYGFLGISASPGYE